MKMLPDSLKKPWVIGVGLALGLVLLFLAMRPKSTGGSSGADISLASQGIAAQQTGTLAGFTTQYNIAGLAFQTRLAELAADRHAGDVAAQTAINLQAGASLSTISRAEAQAMLIREQGAQSIALASENNAAYLDASKLNAMTAIALGPHIETLARIGADSDIARAGITASMATTIAAIAAATASKSTNAHTTDSVINGLPSLLSSVSKLFGSGSGGGSASGGGGSSSLDGGSSASGAAAGESAGGGEAGSEVVMFA